MKNYQITPERKAHLYAMMAWSDQYTKEQAEEIAFTTEYSELNGITWAEDSINTGLRGIVDSIESKRLVVPAQNTEQEWDVIIEILASIHDKWVTDNAKKYDRGNEYKSNKNLFQHLPTAMIGIDELAKDLMFLAPFLEEMGLDAGVMNLVPYGSFKPSKELAAAYGRYVKSYKIKYGIESIEDLSMHIEDCLSGEYQPLVPVSEVSMARNEYMQRHVGLLCQSVADKNPDEFGVLPLSRS